MIAHLRPRAAKGCPPPIAPRWDGPPPLDSEGLSRRDLRRQEGAWMRSSQTLSEADRRRVGAWAADCAERVLPVFEAEAPDDDRARQLIARARAFARGELNAADEIRRRFV